MSKKIDAVWMAEDYAGRLTEVPAWNLENWKKEQDELRAKLERGEIPDPRTTISAEEVALLREMGCLNEEAIKGLTIV